MKHWNPYLATVQRETLLKIELKNFRKYLRYAKEHASFYRKHYDGTGPEDIRTKEDIRRLPLVDKENLRAAKSCLMVALMPRGG